MSYSSGGQLATITDASGRSLSLGYAGGHVTTITDANANPPRVISYQYLCECQLRGLDSAQVFV